MQIDRRSNLPAIALSVILASLAAMAIFIAFISLAGAAVPGSAAVKAAITPLSATPPVPGRTTSATVPDAPTIGTAVAGNAAILVNFTPPANDGGSPITSYTVTCGALSATGSASPVGVPNLVNGTSYTCTVKATNAIGTGAASAASASVTPNPTGGGVINWTLDLQGTGTLPAKVANGDTFMGRHTVATDSSGNIFIAGAVHNGATPGYDWKIAKVSAAGSIIWQTGFDSGLGDDHVYALALDSSGNVAVVGTAWSATGDSDWKVIKYNGSDGSVAWQQSLGAAGTDAAYTAQFDASGNLLVTGILANGSNVNWNIVKYNGSTGATVWTQTVVGKTGDKPRALVIDPTSGDAIVAGRLTTDRPYITTVRFAGATGAVSWTQTYVDVSVTTGAAEAFAYDLALNPDGSVLVAGTELEKNPINSADYTAGIALKYTSAGTLVWHTPLAGLNSPLYALATDGAGGAFFAGSQTTFDADNLAQRVAGDGSTTWSITLGSQNATFDNINPPSNDYINAIALDAIGNPVVAGTQESGKRWAIRKLDQASGTRVWGGELAAGDVSLLYAMVTKGTTAYAFGTWAQTAGGIATLHLKSVNVPANNLSDTPRASGFAFGKRDGTANTQVVSQALTINGVNVPVVVTVSNGVYSIGCTGTFTSAPGVVQGGQTVCVANTASATNAATNVTTLTVGGVNATFTTTSKFPVTVILDAISPPAGLVSGFNIDCTVHVTSPNGTPTGLVQVSQDPQIGLDLNGNPIYTGAYCTMFLDGSGHGHVNTPILGATSSFNLHTVYAGDAHFQRAEAATVYPYQLQAQAQTITFPPIGDQALGSTMTAVATSSFNLGLNVAFTSLTPTVCTSTGTNGTTITMVALGTCTLAANQSGEGFADPAPQVTQSFQVKPAQAITISPLLDRIFSLTPFTLSATGGASTSPVIFSTSTSSVCTSSGTNGATLTMLTTGTCTVVANQAGDVNYAAAPTVSLSFNIVIGSQTIVFNPPADRALGSPAFVVAVTGGGSGNPVMLTSHDVAMCTVSRNGGTVTLLEAGTCILTANQASSIGFTAAAPVTQSFQVLAASFTLSVAKSGSGSGALTSSPSGISCSASCSASFAANTQVTLTAQAAAGSLFVGWAGCPTPAGNVCTMVMNQAQSVTVIYLTQAVDPVSAEFNADGHPDLLWRNSAGALHLLLMNGTTIASDVSLITTDPTWKAVAVADFNGDGNPDLVWMKPNGDVVVWYLVNGVFQSEVPLFTLTAQQVVQGVGDFNGDGKPDLLIRNTSTGELRVRLLNNTTVLGEQSLLTLATNWRVEGVGDFDGDGWPDLLFRDSGNGGGSGSAFIWHTQFSGGNVSLAAATSVLFTIDPVWEIVQVADWNGDDSPDLVFRNRSTGQVFVLLFDGLYYADYQWIPQIDPTGEIITRPQG